MARTRLHLLQSLRTAPAQAVDASGATLTIPFLRLFINLRTGRNRPRCQDAIIDTGALLTIMPWESCQHLADEIEWLTPAVLQGQGDWLNAISGKTGGRATCRPGRVEMSAVHLGPPARVLRREAWLEGS